jgi:hypothetical protein
MPAHRGCGCDGGPLPQRPSPPTSFPAYPPAGNAHPPPTLSSHFSCTTLSFCLRRAGEPPARLPAEMVEEKGLPPAVADRIGEFVVLRGRPLELLDRLSDAGEDIQGLAVVLADCPELPHVMPGLARWPSVATTPGLLGGTARLRTSWPGRFPGCRGRLPGACLELAGMLAAHPAVSTASGLVHPLCGRLRLPPPQPTRWRSTPSRRPPWSSCARCLASWTPWAPLARSSLTSGTCSQLPAAAAAAGRAQRKR